MLKRFTRYLTTIEKKPSLIDLTKNPKYDFVLTKDFYRVDVGLIVCRRPIFLSIDELEVEKITKEHSVISKHEAYPLLTSDLMQFDKNEIFNELKGLEEEPTHSKKTNNSDIKYYHCNSKDFRKVDPNIQDVKSIQHASCYNTYLLVKKNGLWGFPTTKQSIHDSLFYTLEELYNYLRQDNWEAFITSKYPLAVERESIPEKELEETSDLKKCVGRKIFYYLSYHDKGILNKVPKEYDDYAWVSKPELPRFLNEKKFSFISKYLKLVNH